MPSQMTGWGSVEYTLTEETQSPGEELEGASVCPRNLHWVLRNKEIILGLHSSTNQTNIFSKYVILPLFIRPPLFPKKTLTMALPRECGYCSRHYKPCMFSKRERRDEYSVSPPPPPRIASPIVRLHIYLLIIRFELDVSLVRSRIR